MCKRLCCQRKAFTIKYLSLLSLWKIVTFSNFLLWILWRNVMQLFVKKIYLIFSTLCHNLKNYKHIYCLSSQCGDNTHPETIYKYNFFFVGSGSMLFSKFGPWFGFFLQSDRLYSRVGYRSSTRIRNLAHISTENCTNLQGYQRKR